MQAITTKFIPCTNTKPNRVRAKCDAGSIIIPWDNSDLVIGDKTYSNIPAAHIRAVYALLNKLKWAGSWYGGTLYRMNPDHAAFVCTDWKAEISVKY